MQQRIVALLLLLAISLPLSAQWFDWTIPGIPRNADGTIDRAAPAVPRALDGHTDFSGLWSASNERGTLFDPLKYQPWAREIMAEQERSFFAKAPRFNCLPDGPGAYAAQQRRIVQTTDFIAVLNSDMTFRQIHLDGREPVENPILPSWMGYSSAYWEGDTLVVVSNGYNDKTWMTRSGLPHTDQLRTTERYTRTSFGFINLEVTYEDPGALIEPVQATIDLRFNTNPEILEEICNESETAQRHYNGEITQAEEKVVVVPATTLDTYVGTYQGIWLGNLITAEVTLEGGELFLTRTPRYSGIGSITDSAKSLLVPQSQNAFDSSFGLGWIFNSDDNGEIKSVYEVHVSGNWAFERLR
ncbi:MAG: hypothetical protein P8M72_07190 [Gammaproteobacteria bacterium]|nr:hypothetical protein [Gammaproteobacteria bacterium]